MGNHEDALDSYREAEKISSEAAKKDSNDTSAWLENGKALVKLGRYDEALRAYDGAINNSSPYIGNTQKSEAWTGKGNALQAQNKSDEALEAFNKAIDLSPTNIDAWKGRGEAQRAMGLAGGASSSLHVARALSSNVW
jgi:tetratricopeptide (TPR) repeat protein